MLSKNNEVSSISIEGNIGAGKSTFLKLVKEWLSAEIVFEPHEKWQDIGGENLLDKFYNDTSRWAYTFQTYAFITRVIEQENHAKNAQSIQILERSIYSDRYCFAKNCFEMGTMTALEWKLYQEWFSWLVGTHTPTIQGFIYLQTDPEVCFSRLKRRNRSEESTVSLEYLTMIHDKHEKWLVERKGIDAEKEAVPVLILPCNKDFESDVQEQEKHMQKISNFFKIPLVQKTFNEKNAAIRL